MTERYCTVMRIILLDQYMTIESAHLRNCEYTDTAEGLGCYRKYFSFCHICTQNTICCTL